MYFLFQFNLNCKSTQKPYRTDSRRQMEAHTLRVFQCPNNVHVDAHHNTTLHRTNTSVTNKRRRRHVSINAVNNESEVRPRRRDVLVTPLISIGAYILRTTVARADEKMETESAVTAVTAVTVPVTEMKTEVVKKEEVINSRIYDATVIGEPMAVGKDKGKVWEKVMNGRIVYLGEAEQVPTKDDKELEVEIFKNLAKRCAESNRQITLAMEAFPADLQQQLDQYIGKRFVLLLVLS